MKRLLRSLRWWLSPSFCRPEKRHTEPRKRYDAGTQYGVSREALQHLGSPNAPTHEQETNQ